MRAIGLLGVLVGAGYLVWRIGWTLNPGALWLALPLVLAESHGYFTFVLFVFMTWDLRPPARRPAPPGWSVDFFIPTYNEPYEVLALTIAGAVAVRYPHATHVLDDGRRPWVAQLCRQFGVHYLTRPDNAGAKAGNLNHALAHTTGDFIAVVDADFVPGPALIDDLLGYFTDTHVAIVQAPQAFYNSDSFQHAGRTGDGWHEQALFYEVIQPGKNRWNAAFWSGAPSMVRRAALASVGGVATETVTEDLHTSLRLHRAGWKTVYHPGVVARGLAPDDFAGFIGQRLRWAQGAMQVIRREWHRGGLTLAQRLNYIASTSTYFDAWRKAVLLLAAPMILLTDRLPIRAPVGLFLAAWAVQYAVLSAANLALGRGHARFLATELFDLMKMFAFISATPTLLSARPLRFRVTPKGEGGRRALHPFLVPFCALVGVYVLGVAVGGVRLAGWSLTTANRPAMLAAVLWGTALTGMLVAVTVYGYRHVSRRRAYRIPVHVPARITASNVQGPALIQNLTLVGLACTVPVPVPAGGPVTVDLLAPPLRLRGQVRMVTGRGSSISVGVELDRNLDDATPVRLAALLAATVVPPEPDTVPATGPAGPRRAAATTAA